MYSVTGVFFQMNLLAEMAVARKFDSGVSINEQRSLTNFLKNNLQNDVNDYTGHYMHLRNINQSLTNAIDAYSRIIIQIKRRNQQISQLDLNQTQIFNNTKKQINSYLNNYLQPNSKSNFNLLKQELVDRAPFFIELNNEDLNIGNHNPLQDLIVENSRKNETFNYIVSGTIGGATHFFLVEQQGNAVVVKDSTGLEERNDFFQIFLKLNKCAGINYYRVADKLQCSSGVCEMYPIIQMFFDARLRLFNEAYRNSILNALTELPGKIIGRDGSFRDRDASNQADVTDIDNGKVVRLPAILTDGLNEASFGAFEGFVDENRPSGSQSRRMLSLSNGGGIYDARRELINKQKERLIQASNEKYSLELEFKKNFAVQLQQNTQNQNQNVSINISLNLLDYLAENMVLLKEEKIHIISKVMSNLKIGIAKDRCVEAISIMLDESDKLISVDDNLVNKIETDFIRKQSKHTIQAGDLKKVCDLYKKQNFADNLAKAVLDAGKVDLSSPRAFIRAGYAYWKTLEYAEMFDRRVTKYIFSKDFLELSRERKKSMLSAIYPNSNSFSVIEHGDNNIYLKIDDHYNGDNYAKVVNLLNGNYTYNRSTNVDVHSIFNDITQSQDPLDNLSHFIAWNRAFREDIFEYVDNGTNLNFNRRITQFFFETQEVDQDYVKVVAGKYTFSVVNENDNATDYSLIGGDFAHMLIITQGNDRDDTFNTAITKGKTLLHNNHYFRSDVFNWVLNNPTVGIKIKMSSKPVFRYIKNDDNEQEMFVKRLNIQRYLSNLLQNPGQNLNVDGVKMLITDTTTVFDKLLNSRNHNNEQDIDEFAGVILLSATILKASLAPNVSTLQQLAQQNPAAGQPQAQHQPSEEEQVWIDFQDKVKELEQQISLNPNQNVNLQNLHYLFNNI